MEEESQLQLESKEMPDPDEQNVMQDADSAINGDEEILFASDWFSNFNEPIDKGQDAVDKYIYMTEEASLQKEQLSLWQGFVQKIKDMWRYNVCFHESRL